MTGLRPPQAFAETPYLYALLAAGPGPPISSHNHVVVRVTGASLGLTLRDYLGNRVAFRIADQVGSLPFGKLMTDLQGVAVTDAVYAIEQRLTGVTPNRGDRQFLVMDPAPDDGTAPCGLNGNPVRLGVNLTKDNSCLALNSGALNWGVIAHELGHNFLSLNQRSFSDVVAALPNSVAFIEGIATFVGFCALDEIVANPGAYSLRSGTLMSLTRDDVNLTPAFDRRVFFPALASYEAAPNYASGLTADILDAILIRLYDEYGRRFAYRLFSGFVPSMEPQEINLTTEGQRLAFWAAVCSAAAGADLKDRFRTKWAFPLDSVFYDSILPRVRALVDRRGAAGMSPCVAGEAQLCLNSTRFRVEVAWQSPASGTSGTGLATALTSDTGYVWFFSPNNVELVIKVVDGRALNSRFWVFAAGLTNVGVTITVTDTETGAVKIYTNPPDTPFQPIQDTNAFEAGGSTLTAATTPKGIATAAIEPLSSEATRVAQRPVFATSTEQANSCSSDATSLCLNNGRFKIETVWATPQGQSGRGQAVALTSDTGYFWFFSPNNVEIVVKAVTGCGLNSRYWTFAGGLTNVQVVMTVTDTQSGAVRTYTNPQGAAVQPIQDTNAFPCS